MRAPVIVAVGGAVLGVGAIVAYLIQPAPPSPVETPPAPTVAAAAPAPKPAPTPEEVAEPEPRRAAPRPVATPDPVPAPAAAAPTTGTLRIEADVDGATVLLDRVGVGTTPVTVPNVSPGSHRLNVSASGYDGYAETIEVTPGERTITVSFKEIRLDASVDATHKHGMGSCKGRLVATPQGVRYEAADGKDNFTVALADLQTFDLDYLNKSLRIRTRQGRTYNFGELDGNIDKVAYFHRDVDKVRKRVVGQ